MEIRVLRYFLAVAQEQSVTAAAERLHVSQPSLSTQLKALESELGKPLFIRGTKGSRRVVLTEEGMILKRRAEEIEELVRQTENEIALSDQNIAGDIYIGAGETDAVRILAQAANKMRAHHPLVRFHIISGDKFSVLEELEHGVIDFALLFGEMDTSRYDIIRLPPRDRFGVLMRRDDPLAKKTRVRPQDLYGKPLIVSRQSVGDAELKALFGDGRMEIAATYNLLFNGSIMVEEGLGYAVCFDRIVRTDGESPLCFRPLSVKVSPKISLAWKKDRPLTKAAQLFREELTASLSGKEKGYKNSPFSGKP